MAANEFTKTFLITALPDGSSAPAHAPLQNWQTTRKVELNRKEDTVTAVGLRIHTTQGGHVWRMLLFLSINGEESPMEKRATIANAKLIPMDSIAQKRRHF